MKVHKRKTTIQIKILPREVCCPECYQTMDKSRLDYCNLYCCHNSSCKKFYYTQKIYYNLQKKEWITEELVRFLFESGFKHVGY